MPDPQFPIIGILLSRQQMEKLLDDIAETLIDPTSPNHLLVWVDPNCAEFEDAKKPDNLAYGVMYDVALMPEDPEDALRELGYGVLPPMPPGGGYLSSN